MLILAGIGAVLEFYNHLTKIRPPFSMTAVQAKCRNLPFVHDVRDRGDRGILTHPSGIVS